MASLASRAAALRRRPTPMPTTGAASTVAVVAQPPPRALVDRVKCVMKEHGQMAYEHWHKKCGGDPEEHTAEQLAEFVEDIGKMVGRAARIVNEVKQLQGRWTAARVAWEQHCRRLKVPDPDPRKQNALQLQEFLDWWEEHGASVPTWELVNQVRELCRENAVAKCRWTQFCKSQEGPGAQTNPVMQTKDCLETFMAQMREAGIVPEEDDEDTKPADEPETKKPRIENGYPAADKEPSAVSVLVQDLPDTSTAKDLEEHFSIYGRVLKSKVRRVDGELEGLVVLSPEITKDAMQLIRVLLDHSHQINGEQVKVRTLLES
ncbi:unnamed protein product [Durusdinium trenchii]|uniref:RRM domain-containing protein n=1 Tax=Durusdinium trenchii TaxID=1381693 RepID=A0ABP0MCR0_9DINO